MTLNDADNHNAFSGSRHVEVTEDNNTHTIRGEKTIAPGLQIS